MEDIHPGAQAAPQSSSEAIKAFKKRLRAHRISLEALNNHLGLRKKTWNEYLIDPEYGQENVFRIAGELLGKSGSGWQTSIFDFVPDASSTKLVSL